MAEFPAMPLHTDAYMADTIHLGAQEHGAYLMLLMVAWRTADTSLPDDDVLLAKYARVDLRTWRRIKPTILEFWTLENGRWKQKRQQETKENVSKRVEAKRNNGKQGGRPKSLKNNEPEKAIGSDSKTEKNLSKSKSKPSYEGEKQEPIGSSKKRASRLPDDWKPDIEFAKQEGLPEAQARREAEKFRDYWRSQAGGKGVKADWRSTWRNWVRRAADDRPQPRDPTRSSRETVRGFSFG